MTKTLSLAVFLLLTFISKSQNSDYYYYKSKKVSLNKLNTRHYILTKKSKNLNDIKVALSQDGFALEKILPNNVRPTLSNHKEKDEDGNWVIIKGDRALKNYDWIIYKAPFFYNGR